MFLAKLCLKQKNCKLVPGLIVLTLSCTYYPHIIKIQDWTCILSLCMNYVHEILVSADVLEPNVSGYPM